MSDDLTHYSQIEAPPVPTRALNDLVKKANYYHDLVERHREPPSSTRSTRAAC